MKTHKLRRILSLLLAVVMMVNVLPISSMQAEEETVTINGTTYTIIGTDYTTLTLEQIGIKTQGGGSLGSSDTVTDKTEIRVDITYRMANGTSVNEVDAYGNVVAVTLYRYAIKAKNLDMILKTEWTAIGITNGQYYRFVEENGVYYFELVVISENNQSNISGSVMLYGNVDADNLSATDLQNGTITLGFDSQTVTVNYSNSGTLSVSKSANSTYATYNATDDIYIQEWVVTVKASSDGYARLEDFSDLSTGAVGTLYGDISVVIDGVTYTYSSFDDLSAALSGVILTDETITITYSMSYDATEVDNYMSTGSWTYVNNTATLTYNDGKTATGSDNMNVYKLTVSKTSSYSSSDGTITYTIKLYYNGFTGNRSTDSLLVTNISDTLTMGSATEYSESLSIPDLTDSGWTWVEPTNWSDGYWVYTYTYTLTEEQLLYGGYFYNKFEAEIDGDDVSSTASTYITPYDYLTKSGKKVTDENEIEWTVTFTVPYDGFALSDLTITDTVVTGDMTYISGSASATIAYTSGGSTTATVTTSDGTSFTFVADDGTTTFSQGDTITLKYRTTIVDPSTSTSTLTYTNRVGANFPVTGFTTPPSQTETETVKVESSSEEILTKSATQWGSSDYLDYSLTINTSNVASDQVLTIVDQLSIARDSSGLDSNDDTNYLYNAWVAYAAVYGEDYSKAFALDSVNITGGTLADDYSISSTGEITFTITDITATSVEMSYHIVFTSTFKKYLRAAYADAIAAQFWGNKGFFLTNSATAYVDGSKRNTSEATAGTYYKYEAVDYIKKTAKYMTSISDSMDYVAVVGDTVIYTLTINSAGETLNNGNALTVTDTLGSGLSLWSESAIENGVSISQYTYVSSVIDQGSYGQEVTTTIDPSNVMAFSTDTVTINWKAYTSYELLERGTDYSVVYDAGSNVITFTIPDSTPVTIVYYCHLHLKADTWTNDEITNSVELFGENGDSADTESYTIEVSYNQKTSGIGTEGNLIINKVNEDNETIYGATFSLTPVGTNGNATGGTIKRLTVADGDNTVGLNYDTIYKMVETSAPDGYEEIDDVYYVYIQSQTAPSVTSIGGVNIIVFDASNSVNTVATTPAAQLYVKQDESLTITTTDGSISAGNFESDYNLEITLTDSHNATISYPGSFAGYSGTHYWWVSIIGLTEGTYTIMSGGNTVILTVGANGAITANYSGSNGSSISEVYTYNTLTASITIENTTTNSLTINMYADGGSTQLKGAEFTLKANTSLENISASGDFTLSADCYSLTFTTTTSAMVFYGLPDGSYTLTETAAPSGYLTSGNTVTFTVSGGVISLNNVKNDSLTVYNEVDSSAPQTATLTVSKSYADADGNTLSGTDIDSLVAEFTLTPANGTAGSAQTVKITGANTGEFTGLEYNGTYTLSETDVPDGYTAAADVTITIANGEVSGYSNNTVAVTNVAKTSITVYKVWDDGGNRDKTRTSITINLLAGGSKIASVDLTDANETADNTWSYTFTDLDVYDTNGNKIVYTVEEDGVSSVYTSSGEGNSSNNYTITNSYSFKTTEVEVTKAWVGDDNNLSARPSEITVVLTKNGSDSTQTITLNSGNNWTGSFKSLPVNDENGDPIAYGVKEVTVNGYRSDITGDVDDGYTITNTYEPPLVTISVSGTKTWVDGGLSHDNATEITLTLCRTTADNPTDSDWDEVSATVSWSGNTYTYSNLDKYDLSTGKTYTYKVVESELSDYTSESKQTSTGYDFTNTIKQVTIFVSGTKTWIDPAGTTHPDITIELYRDGTKIDDVTLSDGTTTYEFTGLDKYDLTDGHAYKYTVKEVAVSGYTPEQNGNDFTNVQITTEVTVNKVWDDAENQDGLREDYSVTLYKTVNGVETKVDSQTLSANTLTYTWTELPTYETVNGTQYEVSYTVEETGVPSGYTASDPVGDVATGFEITNSHTPYTTEVSVTKVWSDAGDYDGVRPDSITVTLTGSDGKTYTADLTKDNNWEYTFTDLPVYWNEGTEIEYTLEEVKVEGYTSAITGDAENGFTVTNSHTPHVEPSQAYTNIGVTKVWNDDNDADGVRPASVTIALYRDGVATGRTITLSEANNWTASFTHLPVYNGTAAYSYTVAELNVPAEYTATVTGGNGSFTITNTHMPVVEIEEPVEATNTDEEEDGEAAEASETESNPKTGIALSILPMVVAALAVASAKRR